MKNAVIYHSKYGCTREYAEWIAQAAGAELVPLAEAKRHDLAGYDAVAFGCPYYAGRLKISGFVKTSLPKLGGKRVAFFAVGGQKPDDPDIARGFENAFTPAERQQLRFFYLPGRIICAQLNWFERQVMKMMKSSDYDRTDRAAITPLVEFLKG
jgi:menaquinone-dependent protoporphyrinogen IX oxidase